VDGGINKVLLAGLHAYACTKKKTIADLWGKLYN